jgi:CheY-like chemotaxis protein
MITHPGGFTVAVVDSALQTPADDGPSLPDLCVTEGVPVIRLLSTAEVAAQTTPGAHAFLWKPVRASELYNSIVAVATGRELVLRRRDQEPAKTEEVSGRGRVLVVDDNEVNRLVACELLSELGYESGTACDGREAFEKVQAERYDVVLMDCQMPEVDGFAATALIRQLPGEKARVPIIALTAHAMAEDRDRVLRAGMDDYATKPIRGRVLASLLKRWMPDGATLSSPAVLPNAAPEPQPATAAGAGGPIEQTGSEAELLDPTLPRSPRVVELFLRGVPELVSALQAAVAADDVVKVKQLAHKLKGNCLSLGANRMAAVCHAVENAAAAGRVDRAALTKIAPELAAVTPLLSSLLQTQPSNDTKAASA